MQTTIEPITDETTSESPAAAMSWERRQVAKHLGRQFQVVRELGQGGMGVVFLARDIQLHRLVAIKVLRHEFSGDEAHHERFRREARMTARLGHPSIVPVYSFGEIDEFIYIVMKYIHGESLAARLRRDGPVGDAEARQLLGDLALALDHAHRDGVVHRDLKAENVLIDRATGRAMLTDFGVALLRSLDPARDDGTRFGTPHFMSPEQAAGETDLDGRSDLFSLGVVGYLMVTGELPFQAPTLTALAARQITAQHVPVQERAPSIDPGLAHVIECCLEKDRTRRFRSGRLMAESLSRQRATGFSRVVRKFASTAAVFAALAAAVVSRMA